MWALFFVFNNSARNTFASMEVNHMTYKQIEASREARLWIGQVIIPVAMTVVTAANIPEVRDFVKAKIDDVKRFIRRKRT